ncbi:hypothetical protein IWT30_00955 [Secundilactobacillus mixtipabuli]|uniref:Uncharacterized protein n=1 Tax=Secundilactobacillus mixtipabuli TaxID=1435342 RepID=A0A1Z5IBI1_9LACO|nr:hypothetical protein IWT30_00955 [Secundilactobacillus mixtipabuli]
MLKPPKLKKERDQQFKKTAITFFFIYWKQPKPFLISFGFLAFRQLRQL